MEKKKKKERHWTNMKREGERKRGIESLFLKVRQVKELESPSSSNSTAYVDHVVNCEGRKKITRLLL